MSVDKKFLIERQGKQVVLYQGLLDLAHEMGLVSLRSEILQFPNMDNNGTCYAMATAIFRRNGEEMIFQDFADANAGNVTPAMKNCIPRMAATRAKARCLRDGTNCGVTAFEELGDDQPEPAYEKPQRTNPSQRHNEQAYGQRPPDVDQHGEVHDNIPSRPPLSTKQQAMNDFRAAARAIDERYGHPSFKDVDMAKMVKAINEDGAAWEDVARNIPSWKYATGVLRSFKNCHPLTTAETALKAIRFKFRHELPMAEFTATMWESPFPDSAQQPYDARIDAVAIMQAPQEVEA